MPLDEFFKLLAFTIYWKFCFLTFLLWKFSPDFQNIKFWFFLLHLVNIFKVASSVTSGKFKYRDPESISGPGSSSRAAPWKPGSSTTQVRWAREPSLTSWVTSPCLSFVLIQPLDDPETSVTAALRIQRKWKLNLSLSALTARSLLFVPKR